MTDKEKIDMVLRLVRNIDPLDFESVEMAQGAFHATSVAIEVILDQKEG